MAERNPLLYIATGQKGVGKSYRSVYIEAQEYIKNDKAAGRKGRPVIIFDTNNEYREFPAIDFDISKTKKEGKKDVPDKAKIGKEVMSYCNRVANGQAKPQIVRVLPFKRNKEEMHLKEMQMAASILLKVAKNALVVLEDLNVYMTQVKAVDVVGQIVTNRHRGQDVMIHLQSTNALDIRMSANYNILRMHHQPDDVWRKKNSLNNPEIMKLAQLIVDYEFHNGNERAFVYVDNFNNKLIGVNRQQFERACEQYIKKYKTEKEIKPYFDENDESTGKKKSTNTVIKEFIKDRVHYLS